MGQYVLILGGFVSHPASPGILVFLIYVSYGHVYAVALWQVCKYRHTFCIILYLHFVSLHSLSSLLIVMLLLCCLCCVYV
jgi:hypothetical protein